MFLLPWLAIQAQFSSSITFFFPNHLLISQHQHKPQKPISKYILPILIQILTFQNLGISKNHMKNITNQAIVTLKQLT